MMQRLNAQCRFIMGCWLISCCLLLVSSTNADGKQDSVKIRATKPGKSISAKSLDALLKSKSEELWEKGLGSITAESLEDDQIVEAIVRFTKRESELERLTPSLVQAIRCLAEAKQRIAFDKLTSLLTANDYRVVMLAADAVSSTQDPGCLEALMKLTERREYPLRYGFRRCVVDAVGRYRDKRAVDFLVERIENSDGQLKFEIAMNLERTTGQKFGGKAGEWRTWWQANRDEFVFVRVILPDGDTQRVATRSIPWDEVPPRFYGLPIYAKRVVFVIDRSKSMASSVDGETRLEQVRTELQAAIKALRDSDFFNVIAFDNRTELFSPKLVQANDSNKAAAIRFANSLEPRGETACFEPLKMALEASDDLELIVFLSDGEPNAGVMPDPSAIVTAISNLNLRQRTTINTLGIDARDQHELFLKNLAEKNSGKLLLIR